MQNHFVYITVRMYRKTTAGATLNLEQAEIPYLDFDVKQTVFMSL